MKIYQDKNDVKLVHNIASASTLISSLAGIARDYVIEKFPKGYFRSVYIDSEETSSAYYKNKKYNDKVNKIPYPSLSIGTEISLDSPIEGMRKPRELSATNLFINRDLRRSYDPLLVDPQRRFSVYFSSDYITANFNFKITTKKYIQNIDLAYYLKSMFQNDFFLYLNQKELSVELPKTYVKILADVAEMSLGNREDLIRFQDFLASRSVSYTYLKKRVNFATGNPCFFFNHCENILSYFTDLDAPPSVVRNQMTDDEYVASFRIQLSAWLPNSFIMSLNQKTFEKLKGNIENIVSESNDSDDENSITSTTIPINSEFQLLRKREIRYLNSFKEECIGLEVYNDEFGYTANSKDQYYRLYDQLPEDLKQVYRYLNRNYRLENVVENENMDFKIEDVFQVRTFVKSGPSDSVEVDYNNGLMLTIKSYQNFFEDIAVSVYVDRTAVEAIKKAMEKNKFFFNKNLFAPLYINIGGEELRVKVYSFESEAEKNSYDIEKSLRIQTIYGIGYIGLKKPKKDQTGEYEPDNYYICVGTTKNKSGESVPIIRTLELYNN